MLYPFFFFFLFCNILGGIKCLVVSFLLMFVLTNMFEYSHLDCSLTVFHLMICAAINARSIIPLVIAKWSTSNSIIRYAFIR